MSLLNRQMKLKTLLTFVMKLLVIPSLSIINKKIEIDINKFNQNINNMHLDDMFTTGLQNF